LPVEGPLTISLCVPGVSRSAGVGARQFRPAPGGALSG